MATVPSLSSAFSSLLSPFSSLFGGTPAKPNTSSYTSVGVSSPAALSASAANATAAAGGGAYKPATATTGGMSIYTPSTPAIPSYQAANNVAAKGTVPYIPATATTGGMSVVPTSTSAKTGLPTSSLPGAISPATSKGYIPPVTPAIPNMSATPSTQANSGSAMPALPSIGATPAASSVSPFSAASLDGNGAAGSFDTGGAASGAPSAAFGSSSSGGYNLGGTAGGGSATALPYAYDSTDTNSTDPYGLSYFSSNEQSAAEKALMDALQMSPGEVATQKQLDALNAGAASSYSNTAGQSIPLPFITGQQAQIQREQATLAQPLESSLALAQAQRQLQGTAAQAALTEADNRIANYDSFMKPVSTAYGGTLSQFDPTTGTYKTLVNPFGTATGTANGTDTGAGSTNAILGQLAAAGIDTTRYNIPGLIAAVQNGATPADILAGRGAAAGIKAAAVTTANAGPAADAASLKTQQAYLDTTNRAYQTATQNFTVLQNFMQQYGLNQSNVPLINQLQNKIKAGVADPGAVAAFNSQLAGLRAEYAQVLSRGGEVTDSSRASAASLIPDDLSPAQLATIEQQLNLEAGNAISESQSQINTIQGRINTNGSAGTTNFGTSSGSSSSNPFSASNFFGT